MRSFVNTFLKNHSAQQIAIARSQQCDCVNVEMGSYANEVVVKREELPQHMQAYVTKSSIGIDKCLYEEVKELWALGITTTSSCCGHNKEQPFIGVIDVDIQRMKGLGYTVAFNPCRPSDEDSFLPKSINPKY